MAENITTLNEIREWMEQTDAPGWNDLLYAERGTGSDRARAFTVGEIAAAGMEQSFSDDGDIEFTPVQTSAGTAYKGDIKTGAVDETSLADVLDMLQKALRWMDSASNRMSLDAYGLKFFDKTETQFSSDGLFRFDRDGTVKLGKLVMQFRHFTQSTPTSYHKMTDCEDALTSGTPKSWLTEYLSNATQGNYLFVLNSGMQKVGGSYVPQDSDVYATHEAGSVIMVSNLSTVGDLMCLNSRWTGSGTASDYLVAEIPPESFKLFIRRVNWEDTSGDHPVYYPVWKPLF